MYLKKLLPVIMLVFVISAAYSQNAGTLDENFGNNGIVVTNLYNRTEVATSMDVYSDGRIVLGGTLSDNNEQDVILACYLEDGSLDAGFSGDGLLRLNYPGSSDNLNDLVVQDDGKIVFVGETSGDDYQDIIVARLNEDGSFDNTFSNDGMLVIDINDDDYGRAVAIQDDGKIVIAGSCVSDGEIDLIMCRLNPDGTFDNTFAGNGKLIYDLNWGSYDYMNDVALYGGNIFVSGYCWEGSNNRGNKGVAVVKIDDEGQVVSSFGDNGLAFIELDVFDIEMGFGSKMAINSNGIYVAARYEPDNVKTDMAVVNILHNGYPNSDFGNQGIVIVEMVVNSAAYGIALQPDGKILTAGKMYADYSTTNSFVARFLTNGELDADFGEYYGVASVDISPGKPDAFYDLCLQEDHKIVACGYANFEDMDFSAARFYSGLEVGMPETDNSLFDQVNVINPVKDHTLLMDFNLPEPSTVEAKLFTTDGKYTGMLFRSDFDQGKYKQHVKLNSGLPSGIYVLQVWVNGKQKSYKVLIN